VLVVGGGQAGLAAGYYLAEAGLPFLILDASARVGDSWRARWESLQLFSIARYSALPGIAFPGDPERFAGKDEVADYLERYATELGLPVVPERRVIALEAVDGGYRAETTAGSYEAAHVIVATGAYQRPFVPPLAAKLSDEVTQLHSAEYRNPEQVSDSQVLVVGAANSGAQIAEDLAPGHRVHLSRGGRIKRLPLRILGKGLHWWGDHLGLITAPLEGSLRGRTQRKDMLIGTSLRQLRRRHGVELLGRAVHAEGRTMRFEGRRELEVEAVVWATGFRSDYFWIRVPILDEAGEPVHRRGVTESPGLYFLGMHGQYSRGSSLIGFVKDDAAFVVDRISGSVRRAAAR
jgi:putative flavoprotein involved in K+ transport